MFWLWVSSSTYFVSLVQGDAKWEDTWTADRTWPGLFLANLLLKSQPVCILLLWHFPWSFLPCLFHPWRLEPGYLSQLFTPVPPVCSLASDLKTKWYWGDWHITGQSHGGATFTSRSYEPSIAQTYWLANRHSNPRDQTHVGLGKARFLFCPLEPTHGVRSVT